MDDTATVRRQAPRERIPVQGCRAIGAWDLARQDHEIVRGASPVLHPGGQDRRLAESESLEHASRCFLAGRHLRGQLA